MGPSLMSVQPPSVEPRSVWMEEVRDIDQPQHGVGLSLSDPVLLGLDEEDWVPS